MIDGGSPGGFARDDLDLVCVRALPALEALRGARIFMTGATGFVGRWLLASLMHARDHLGLRQDVLGLSRDPRAFLRAHPSFGDRDGLSFVAGDIRTFEFPDGPCDVVVHAATDTSVDADRRPMELVDSIILGTRRVLEYCERKSVKRMLYLSSGAVYGPQPSDVGFLHEGSGGGPDQLSPHAVYGEAKRASEMLCAIAGRNEGPEVVVARIFAAVGPGLPLDAHFAIGNFIRDAMDGRDIRVASDGSAQRSYIYAADLAAWLLTLLARGRGGVAYNVGSDEAISIGELAARVRGALNAPVMVDIAGKTAPGAPRLRYIPDITRARSELGLDIWTSLDAAIRRTAAFANHNPVSRKLRA